MDVQTAFLARKTASKLLGREMTGEEWNNVFPRALAKLRRILDREGDAGGVRMEGWYFGQLLYETALSDACAHECREWAQKKKAASEEDSQPASILYDIEAQKVNRRKPA